MASVRELGDAGRGREPPGLPNTSAPGALKEGRASVLGCPKEAVVGLNAPNPPPNAGFGMDAKLVLLGVGNALDGIPNVGTALSLAGPNKFVVLLSAGAATLAIVFEGTPMVAVTLGLSPAAPLLAFALSMFFSAFIRSCCSSDICEIGEASGIFTSSVFSRSNGGITLFSECSSALVLTTLAISATAGSDAGVSTTEAAVSAISFVSFDDEIGSTFDGVFSGTVVSFLAGEAINVGLVLPLVFPLIDVLLFAIDDVAAIGWTFAGSPLVSVVLAACISGADCFYYNIN